LKGRPRLYFLDPPYYVKGEGLYDNFYGHADHVRIRKAMNRIKDPWIVSYDAAPEIAEIYSGVRSVRYDLAYTARERTQGSEIMFVSPGLQIPHGAPPDVSTSRVHLARAGAVTLPFS
jgi:DNA adenine methylase